MGPPTTRCTRLHWRWNKDQALMAEMAEWEVAMLEDGLLDDRHVRLESAANHGWC
jgi:hypothetical protein